MGGCDAVLTVDADANPRAVRIEKIWRKKWAIRVCGIVLCGEFLVLDGALVCVGESGDFGLRKRELANHPREPGCELAATTVLGPVVIVLWERSSPIEDGPKFTRENRFLYGIAKLLGGRHAQEFV